jgi:hypothetical protein
MRLLAVSDNPAVDDDLGRTGRNLMIFFIIINDAQLSRWKNVFMLNPKWP